MVCKRDINNLSKKTQIHCSHKGVVSILNPLYQDIVSLKDTTTKELGNDHVILVKLPDLVLLVIYVTLLALVKIKKK
jgi:hypothetical protein